MTAISRKSAPPKIGFAHPLSVDLAKSMAEFAWRDGFVPAFQSTPHADEDPEGTFRAVGQRAHLQLLIALFAKRVGEHAVAVGLYPSLDAFFSDCGDEAIDRASAAVDREGETS